VDDKWLFEAAAAGEVTEIMHAIEPADEPVFFVFQRKPV